MFRRANDAKAEEPRACRSAEFENFYFPTCNNFHEIDLGRPYDEPEMPQPRPENQLAKVRYLGHGYYREKKVEPPRSLTLITAKTYIIFSSFSSKMVVTFFLIVVDLDSSSYGCGGLSFP